MLSAGRKSLISLSRSSGVFWVNPVIIPKPPALDTAEASSENPGGDESILLVDDEQGLLTFAEQLLKSWGYKVYCAKNAEEALKILGLL